MNIELGLNNDSAYHFFEDLGRRIIDMSLLTAVKAPLFISGYQSPSSVSMRLSFVRLSLGTTIRTSSHSTSVFNLFFVFRPRRSRSAAAYSHQTFPCTICRSVCLSVCPVHCGKTTDRSRQPFGTIRRTGPRMRQVLGFGNLSTGRGTFGGEFGPHHCNQCGLYGVRVRQCLNRRSCGFRWCLRWA